MHKILKIALCALYEKVNNDLHKIRDNIFVFFKESFSVNGQFWTLFFFVTLTNNVLKFSWKNMSIKKPQIYLLIPNKNQKKQKKTNNMSQSNNISLSCKKRKKKQCTKFHRILSEKIIVYHLIYLSVVCNLQ